MAILHNHEVYETIKQPNTDKVVNYIWIDLLHRILSYVWGISLDMTNQTLVKKRL